MPQATVTIKDLPALKKAYKKAVEKNKDYFVYRDSEFITSYAKYLIEFLEMEINTK